MLLRQTSKTSTYCDKKMKVYTKTGDLGETSLFGGTRVKKNHLRLESYGSLDELNSHIGLLADSLDDNSICVFLRKIQARIFDLGAELANEKKSKASKVPTIKEQYITELEVAIDQMQTVLPPMKYFILPGGHITSSYAHIARTVCRRCERLIISLSETSEIDPMVLKYINRLSDYLFVLARYVLKTSGKAEIPWVPDLD